ncbi:MAG: YbaB/EbfC family nucleoid-associated protein [Christensenellaceae bacterium]|jgi:DNA-binding YbaB/EbfC family protein|nr:YbaB/EbfC family nucleoid-associated protein [Christensenellaceae bacterium]
MANFQKMGGMGGGGNMQAMMRQAQEMQKQIEKTKEELAETVIEASVGGDMVKVEMTGAYELINLKIKPEALDPEDPEMTEDLVIACVNEVINQVSELRKQRLPM